MSGPPVTVERDGPLSFFDAGDVQISADGAPDAPREALVTVAIPLTVLAALRALLNHPQLAALLDSASNNPDPTLRLIA